MLTMIDDDNGSTSDDKPQQYEKKQQIRLKSLSVLCPFGAHSASAWQVPRTSAVWFCCRAVCCGCHVGLEIVGGVAPKF